MRAFLLPLSLLLLHVLLLSTARPSDALPVGDVVPHAHTYDRKPSARLRRAEAHLTRLIAANNCRGKPACRPPTNVKLAAATRAMQSAARAERRALKLQAPPYRTFVFEPLRGPPLGTVMLLHGFSRNPLKSIEDLTPALRAGLLQNLRIVAPMAFERREDSSGQTQVPSWFDFPAPSTKWAVDIVLAAAGNASAVLDTACSVLGRSRALAAVGGESQGAAVSLALAMRHPAVSVSCTVGFVPAPGQLPHQIVAREPLPPVLMINSVDDELVPISYARLSARIVRQLGFPLEYEEVTGVGHDLGEKAPAAVARSFQFVRASIRGLPKPRTDVDVIDDSVSPVVWELL